MSSKYDVIIVGAGPAGIFCAYEFIRNRPNAKILLIEKGHDMEHRKCPKRKTEKCCGCSPCAITAGFSGSGAFSDGKLTLTRDGETGGELFDIVGYDEGRRLIEKTDRIYLDFGAPEKLYGTSEHDREIRDIRKDAISANLKLVECPIRHLGTDGGYEVYLALQEFLMEKGVDILFDTTVTGLILSNDGKSVYGVTCEDKNGSASVYDAYHVVVGAGRPGASWFENICREYGIDSEPGVVDVGVRVEVRNEVMERLNDALYEAKLIYHTPTFDDKVRTFCTNPGGAVSTEVYDDGTTTVNGHAYADADKRTDNTNFALLVSKKFTSPFKEPVEYGKSIARMANMLADGKVLVQRFGDFQRGRRTIDERLHRNNIVPTLKDAVAGDLSLVLPYRIMKDIEEMLYALDKVSPGIASEETLLYGVEVKFYSNRVKVNNEFETNIEGLYAIGDGAGVSRGLIQASADGVKVGEVLTEKLRPMNTLEAGKFLFGEMRPSTPAEMKAYRDMLERKSTSVQEIDIFDLCDDEIDEKTE